jgi:lincosamide nucleotidyltransferase B/F
MVHKELLLARLDAIGASLAKTAKALALLGLGSVGLERDRLDDYSDLDFFVIVKPGNKQPFIDTVDWLEAVYPVAYAFQNTTDGCKVMFEDGVFCEFAIFEPDELAHIPFAAGRIIWKEDDFDDSICAPTAQKTSKPLDVDWQVGEALTNLYVGLCRCRRGEKLSGARFVQVHAVDRVVELTALVETQHSARKDQFTYERRYEQRFPLTAQKMTAFMPGYEYTPQAAKAILEFLEQHFTVNRHMKKMILLLCDELLESQN